MKPCVLVFALLAGVILKGLIDGKFVFDVFVFYVCKVIVFVG